MLETAAAPAATTGRTDRVDPLLHVFLVALVLTQRFGIPLGSTSVALALPLSYAFIVVLLVRRRLTFSRLRTELFLLAAVAVLVVTATDGLRGGLVAPTSLMLLLAIYLPWVLHLRGVAPAAVRSLGRTYVRLMTVLAVVGVAQLSTQLLGVWKYSDFLGDLVGKQWITGVYNFSTPLVYASPVYKANAFVMLEPSFFSQFCALAVVIGVVLRARPWQLVVLMAGLASAVSGTGIVLLIGGVLLLLLRAPRRIRPGHVVAAVVAAVAVLVSPVAPLLLNRSGETTQQGSSGYLRFVQPYQETLRGLEALPERWLSGAGPGAAERLLTSYRGGLTGEAVTYTIVPKLVFEYGILAGGLFVLFIVVSMLDRAPWRAVPGTLVLMTFLLSGALLQPQTAFLAWLLTSVWTANPPVAEAVPLGAERERAGRRRRRTGAAGGSTAAAPVPGQPPYAAR